MAKARKWASRLVKAVVEQAERLHGTTAVSFTPSFDNPRQLLSPGGQCSCCGQGPKVADQSEWWLVFRAGFTDGGGVYYPMLCDNPTRDGCLSEVRNANAKRTPTRRDEAAAIISDLMGDDLDGAEAFMDDLNYLGEFD